MKVLQTSRVSLTPVTETDLPFLLDLRWDKKVCESIIFEPITMDKQLKWFKELKNAEMFVIRNSDLARIGVIGIFDIHSIHRRAKWTLRIHPDYWRQGYATESIKFFLDYIFNTLNINKLMGDCFADNIAEINNITKLGFRQEGIWKEHYFHRGEYRDSIQFVMLKKEYELHKHLHLCE